jgi:hypothetical protein
LHEPQTWNRYAYVSNNPLKFTDPDGRYRTFYKEKSLREADVGNAPPYIKTAFYIEGALLLQASGSLIRTAFSTAQTITRYMGEGEARTASNTHSIPNTDAQGNPRPTHVTTDKPLNSSEAAQSNYSLPVRPTHAATVPQSRVPGGLQPAPSGPTATGGGSQAVTDRPIPVKPNEIKPLDRSVWDRVLDFFR